MARRPHVLKSVLAVTSDGTVLLNLGAYDGTVDLETLVALARDEGRPVFIGVALAPKETRRLTRWIAGALEEAAARILGGREARRRDH